MRVVRLLLMATLVASLVGLASHPAAAGGSWFDPARDRYEPGQAATIVGYTGGGQLGWIEDGPFFGYLRVDPAAASQYLKSEDGKLSPVVTPSDLPLGPLVLQETGRGGYLSLRAAITFTLPAQLPPARYEFVYCNVPCTTGLGDLIGGSVWVGIDPEQPLSRDWPSDDPALRGAPAAVPLPAPPPTTTPPPTTAPPTSPPATSAPTTEAPAAPDPAPAAVRTVATTDEGGTFPWPAALGALVVVALGAVLFLRGPRPRPRLAELPHSPPPEPDPDAPREPAEAGAAHR